MPRLPILSGKEVVKILEAIGYEEIGRQSSHIRLSHPERKSVTVPDYKMVSRGLLRKILRDAELTPEEFIKIIEN